MAHHPVRRAAAAACLLATLAACSDDSPALPGNGEPPDLGATGGVPSSVATAPRFDVKVEVGGALRPGLPVVITGVVTGIANTQDAEIELVVPELAGAEASSWTNFRPYRVGRVPGAAMRRGAVGKGVRNVVQQTVTFPIPGIYTVWVSARVLDQDSLPDVENGAVVLDQAHVARYLLIDENGGRVLERFDPRLLPPTAVSAPGPVRLRPGVLSPPATLPIPTREPSSRAAITATPGATAGQTGSYRLVVDYYDASKSTYTPVEGATWYLYFYDSAFNYTGTGRSGYLPADGSVSVGCADAYWVRLVVYAKSPRITVGGASDFRSGQIIEDFGTYPASDCASGTLYTDADAIPSHVFVNLDKTASRAETLFGRTRPSTPAVLTSDVTLTYSTYCPPTGTYQGCNFGGGDYLRIQLDSTTAYGQQVWGKQGVFITSHEYGHAYHEKALGGFIRYFGGCGAHSLTALATSMRCALPEAFADYFAVVTRPDETGYDYAWETNYYYNTYLPTSDGSRSEAAVAATFYDLVDTNRWGAETHDVVAYGNSVVGDVITGCQAYEGGAWILNNGIDHLVYCFERKVDTAITGSTKYFPTRSPDPTSWSVTSAVTSPTEVRKIWRKNLYNEN